MSSILQRSLRYSNCIFITYIPSAQNIHNHKIPEHGKWEEHENDLYDKHSFQELLFFIFSEEAFYDYKHPMHWAYVTNVHNK